MPTATASVLDQLRERRKSKFDEWDSLVEARESERSAFEVRLASTDDKPTDDEIATFRAAEVTFKERSDALKADYEALDERIADQKLREERGKVAAEGAPKLPPGDGVVRSEPLTYTRESGMGIEGVSYYRDLAQCFAPGAISFQCTDREQSLGRLQRHAKEMDVEMPKRNKSRERRAYDKAHAAAQDEGRTLDNDPFHRGDVNPGGLFKGYAHNPFHDRKTRSGAPLKGAGVEYRTEPNASQGQGGYFIPPLWLEDDYIPQLVAHLVAAALCRQMDLPMGTDSINIPKVSNGTAVGYQQANNSGVLTQDFTDTSVQGNVKTIAGDSDVALQLLEQSPHGLVDEVITTNLMQQYNKFLDQQVLAGDGVNASALNGGHLLGLYPSTNWSGTNSVTYTASTPAGYQFAQVLGAMASQVSEQRFNADNYRVVMHGKRWFWYSTAPDSNDRPLGESSQGGPFNVQAAIKAGLTAEGLVGFLPHVAGVPVYIDQNITTADTTGGGSGQDVAIAGLWDDAWLFQGALRTNVYREVLSSSLGVRFQVYNYVAFLVRYGQSFAVATGSGFAAPTGQGASPSWTASSTAF